MGFAPMGFYFLRQWVLPPMGFANGGCHRRVREEYNGDHEWGGDRVSSQSFIISFSSFPLPLVTLFLTIPHSRTGASWIVDPVKLMSPVIVIRLAVM